MSLLDFRREVSISLTPQELGQAIGELDHYQMIEVLNAMATTMKRHEWEMQGLYVLKGRVDLSPAALEMMGTMVGAWREWREVAP